MNQNKRIRIRLAILFIMLCSFAIQAFSQSMVYVGGHFRRERPSTIDLLKTSGFETVILFNIAVEPNGNLTSDGELICEAGAYVFDAVQPHYASDVKALVTGETTITRVETCIGGWGSESYTNIRKLVEEQGTEATSILYKNFKALIEAIPEMNIVNNDDEHGYHVPTASAFTIMLYDLGFKSTIAPYMNKDFWSSLVSTVNTARPGAIERNYVQCYDGGGANSPCDWKIGNVPLWAGKLNYDSQSAVRNIFTNWKNDCGTQGGFIWVYNDSGMSPSSWASLINPIFSDLGISPRVKINNGAFQNTTRANVKLGDSLLLAPEDKAGEWHWKGPNNFTVDGSQLFFKDVNFSTGGNYILTYTNTQGQVFTKNFLVQVSREDNSEAKATCYDNWNFSGSTAIGLDMGHYNAEGFDTLGIAVNDITSIHLANGYGAMIYSEDDFSGDSACISSSIAYLKEWDKKIASIKMITVITGDGTGLQADYYTGTDFETKELTKVTPTIDYNWEYEG
ncbi:MAG: hypothetical protein PF444_03175, partial [Bacteroidales bacterium]|nr:hypothetical protein [Bacteroidales bacterium]